MMTPKQNKPFHGRVETPNFPFRAGHLQRLNLVDDFTSVAKYGHFRWEKDDIDLLKKIAPDLSIQRLKVFLQLEQRLHADEIENMDCRELIIRCRRYVNELSQAEKPAEKKRKTKNEKIALIVDYKDECPDATSVEIGSALGIHDSDVRRLSKAILKNARNIRRGAKNQGEMDVVDVAASCGICRDPIKESFYCDMCDDAIVGACKTCHFTNFHPDRATP